MKILFLLANIAHIALFTMEHVGALNALVDCIALSAEVVVFWDTFKALLELLAMKRFVVVDYIAFITIITVSVIFLETRDAFLTFHAMKVAFSSYSVYAFVAEVTMEFILFILTKYVALFTKVT